MSRSFKSKSNRKSNRKSKRNRGIRSKVKTAQRIRPRLHQFRIGHSHQR